MSISAKQAADTFAAFFSPKKGHFVTRPGSNQIIGGRRDPKTGRTVIDEDKVIAISADEERDFGRLYAKHVRREALEERTAEDFAAYLGAQEAKNTPEPAEPATTDNPTE